MFDLLLLVFFGFFVTKFVKSKFHSFFYSDQSKASEEERRIFPVIYDAVIDNRETAKEQLGDELIKKLSHLFYDSKNIYSLTTDSTKLKYAAYKEILFDKH